jgi:UDP-N-acetylmuramoyl-L-alanyl-D-glutamate--2,6-diaminopimelate ligase
MQRERRAPVNLGDLLDVLPKGGILVGRSASAQAVSDIGVHDVTHDSRGAGPGILFACRPGRRSDGHDYAPAAVAAGSPALLAERPLPVDVPQLVVPSVAAALAPVAARVHGDPSADMLLCAVTGTNGKTTSAYLLESILRTAGHTTGLIGTVETRIACTAVPGMRTTPEATDLQRLLRRMVSAGVSAAAMEVSSHGLALGRVSGTRFAVALFTNLTQDHLDFHRDLEDYFAAKALLFTPAFTPVAVINVDDPFGRRLAAAAGGIEVVRVAVSGRHDADVKAQRIEPDAAGPRFEAVLPQGVVRVQTRLPGLFNVANALGAVTAAAAIGIDLDTAAAGVVALRGVPGRMERVDAGQPFTVLVDYAHTPDSVENVLRAVRALTDGRVLLVVGCGGDRDHGKRPAMGRAAAELADLAVLTSDNPRDEDPRAILDAVVAGAATVPGARYRVELDRRAAIAEALAEARPGDVVVLAGKGHETYQELAGEMVPFDDRQVVRELLTAGVTP